MEFQPSQFLPRSFQSGFQLSLSDILEGEIAKARKQGESFQGGEKLSRGKGDLALVLSRFAL